jgi:tetratricopeptide (TPR) repeat protein
MKDKDLQKMIRYLEGEMGKEEKDLFEQEIISVQSLSKLKCLMEEIDETVSDSRMFDLVNKLKETQELYNAVIGATYVVAKERRTYVNWKHIAAAGITLLLVISTVVINFSRSSNDRIFASYYVQYKGNLEDRSSGHVNPMIYGVQQYDKGNYSEAIAQFSKIIKTDGSNTAAHFFSGISSIELRSYERAIANLSYVIDKNDIAYSNHARWYLALCYLETNQTNLAAVLLDVLANNDNEYKTKALDLLKKIH